MGNDELESIRNQYLSRSRENIENQAEESKHQQELEVTKQNILRTILSEGAKARLANIKLVKPDRAQNIEAQLIQLHQLGRLQDKVTEEQLLHILKQFSSQKRESKIQFKRG